MAEKAKPSFLERVSKTAFWGGALVGLRLIAVNLFSIAAADALTAGVFIGGAVGGTIYLINKLAHRASPTKA
ncbi:MAG: hypothetical protein NTZ55_00145 [Candidatus Roizmanbacteria bacterium]|nr:hypothetical protein [Candidatus Roizmanbacteria bacterium]